MIKKLFLIFFLFVVITNSIIVAQENKIVVLKLKNGYSVKGVIIEKTDQFVKIRTTGGEIFEYKTEEIEKAANARSSSSSSTSSSASTFINALKRNDKIVNLSIGIGGKILYGSSNKLILPPIPISFEYILVDNLFNGKGSLGCGGFFGYSVSKESQTGYYYKKITDSKLIIATRGYIHYAFINKLDTYAGVLLGYKSDGEKSSGSDYPKLYPDKKTNDGMAAISVFTGCRYFFSTKFAVTAEVGWGVSILNIGVAVKL